MAESTPQPKVSEQQARALRRYNESAWFVQEAMQVAQLDETLSAGIAKLLKAATPDWDHAKGRTNELAFLLLMARGFDTSPNCANGSEQFREVIGRGKEYLRERRSADVEARVHFMMGDAYRDIVALGGHHGGTYADPSK